MISKTMLTIAAIVLLVASQACAESSIMRATFNCASQNLSVEQLRYCAKTAATSANKLGVVSDSMSMGKLFPCLKVPCTLWSVAHLRSFGRFIFPIYAALMVQHAWKLCSTSYERQHLLLRLWPFDYDFILNFGWTLEFPLTQYAVWLCKTIIVFCRTRGQAAYRRSCSSHERQPQDAHIPESRDPNDIPCCWWASDLCLVFCTRHLIPSPSQCNLTAALNCFIFFL